MATEKIMQVFEEENTQEKNEKNVQEVENSFEKEANETSNKESRKESRKRASKKGSVLSGDNKFDIRKIIVRDYRIISRRINLLFLSVFFLLGGITLYLLYDNYTLRSEMDKRIYVQINNQIYEAVKTEKITENIARGFTDLAFSYLFNHDEYNYLSNIEIARNFFRRKSYNYILSRFNTKTEATEGLTLFEMYQTYDARMNFIIHNFQFQETGWNVYIEGEMRHVFEAQEPKLSLVKFQFQLERVTKSADNPYGLRIKGLKPVK